MIVDLIYSDNFMNKNTVSIVEEKVGTTLYYIEGDEGIKIPEEKKREYRDQIIIAHRIISKALEDVGGQTIGKSERPS